MILKHTIVRKIVTGKSDRYTAGSLLDYPCFESHYKLIAINLSKQQKSAADPKATEQINFARNLTRAQGATMFSLLKK